MILQHTEHENITMSVRLDLPTQEDVDDNNEEMDLWLKTDAVDVDGGFILNLKDIFLEAADTRDRTEAILAWLVYYQETLSEKLVTL